MIAIFDSSVYEWGLQVIHDVQEVKSVFLTYLMIFISFLSDPLAYLGFLPVFFWCVDEKKTFKAGLFILFSASLNTSIKDFLKVPRPYVQDPTVGLIPEHGFSTPSGHSQNSAAFWPYTLSLFVPKSNSRKELLLKCLLSIALPLVIGFSRIYLGVHYPSDVLLGLTIGFLLSMGAILFVPLIETKLKSLPRSFKILSIGILSIILNWLGPNDTSMAAAFFGLGIGYIYLIDKNGYNAKEGTLIQKSLRIILGLLVLGFIYGGLKFFFPSEGENNYQLFRFLRYFLVGFSASFLLPKFFIYLKIAKSRSKTTNE